jgi:hypothetical protein
LLQEYVQYTFQENENTLIILAHKKQFEIWQTLKQFEIDMNYKWLGQQKLNEIVFAAFYPTHGKGRCISQLVAGWLLTG